MKKARRTGYGGVAGIVLSTGSTVTVMPAFRTALTQASTSRVARAK